MTGGLSPGWPLLELLMRPVSRGSKDAAVQQYPLSRRLPPQRRGPGLSEAGGVSARPYTRAHERHRGRGAPLRRAVGRLPAGARLCAALGGASVGARPADQKTAEPARRWLGLIAAAIPDPPAREPDTTG